MTRALAALLLLLASPGLSSYASAAAIVRPAAAGSARSSAPLVRASLSPVLAAPAALPAAASALSARAVSALPAAAGASLAAAASVPSAASAARSLASRPEDEGRDSLRKLFDGSLRPSRDEDVMPAGHYDNPDPFAFNSRGLKPSGDWEESFKPVPPAPSLRKGVWTGWVLPLAGGTAVAWGLDMVTKWLAPKYVETVFHEAAWRAPLLMVVIPYLIWAAVQARYAITRPLRDAWHWSILHVGRGEGWREKLGFYKRDLAGVGAMLKDHPSLKKAMELYDVAIALMLGGMLGNGMDVILKGGALDFIPVGRSMINVADVTLLLGLAYFQVATRFFERAGDSYRNGGPLSFGVGRFLALPIVGIFLAWTFGSGPSDQPLALVMSSMGWVFLMGLSMLLGISRVAATAAITPFAERFRREADARRSRP